MKDTTEFLDGLPLLPCEDLNLAPMGEYRIKGSYCNGPAVEMDGRMSHVKPVFGLQRETQEVEHGGRTYRRERIGDGPFQPWYIHVEESKV